MTEAELKVAWDEEWEESWIQLLLTDGIFDEEKVKSAIYNLIHKPVTEAPCNGDKLKYSKISFPPVKQTIFFE